MSSVRKIFVTALAAVAVLAVALMITACGSVTLTGISVTTPPSVTTYTVGDVFNTDGMVVTAEYDDGTTKEVTDYTVSPSKFEKAGKQTVTITYEGKTATVEVTVAERQKVLESIEVTTEPTDTEYFVGDSLNTAGMVVTATYDDDSTAPVTGYTVSPEQFDEAGEVTVTVTYQGKTDTFTVTVSEVELSSLEVTGTPETTTYNVGDTFSESGLAVKATYNNGSENAAFGDATLQFSKTGTGDWSETLTLAKGDTKVYVRAVSGEVTSEAVEFAVTVNVPAQSVTIEGDDLILYVGNGTEKDTATLSAAVTPSDTTDSVTWEIVSGSEYITLDGSTVTAVRAGEAVVRAVAGDKSDTINVTVRDNVIDSITVTNVNISGDYIEWQALPATAVTATVEMTYTDGTRKLLNSGEYLLEISLTEGSGWGDNITLPTSGPVSVYIQVTVEGTTVRGTTVSEVVVSEKKLESIAITEKGSLDKTQYVEGQTPVLQGSMTVTATYNNEKTDTIDDGYTLQYYVGTAAPGEGDWVSTMPALKTGDTTVYVRAEYDGVYSEAVAYGVTVVEKEVVSVELSNVTFGKTYIEGNTLEAADVSADVLATYNDESSAELKTGEYTLKVSLDGSDWADSVTLSAGKVTVYVQVTVNGTSITDETTATVDVSEKTLVSISVTTEPTDKEYYVGDSLDKTGMVVTAEYNNGSSETVTGYTVSPAKFDTAGEAVVVTISYGGYEDTFTVKVIAVELSSLEVTGTPETTTYNVGDTFSESGLAVKATYNNGSENAAFGDATLQFSKTGTGDWSETLSLAKGDTKVYVRAVSGEVTSEVVEFTVTVNVPATDITLNFTEITLENGDSVQLTATAAPSDTTDKVTFTVTEGDEFIDIDGDGNLTAKAVGKAVITVTAGSIEKTVTVWVYETTVTVNLPDAIIVGEQFEFTVTTTLNAPEGMPAITVLGNVELSEGIAVEYYENAGALAGQWVTFVGGHFGPESGFPLTDGATSRFRATVSTETQLTFTVQIIDASVNSTVYAEDVVTVNAVTRALNSIAVTMNPTKTEYAVGETFDPAGMIVTAYYTDGDNEQVTGYTVSPEQFNEAGVIEVTVTYKDGSVTRTATITVTVTSVTIEGESLTLYVGNGTTNSTATLTAVVEPDAEAVWTIESGSEYITLDGNTVTAIKAGEAVIKVTAGAASDTIKIVVEYNKVTDIDIVGATTAYLHGDKFVSDGMGIVAHYADGSASDALYTGYTVKENDAAITTETVLGAGEHTLTVSYSDNGTTVENTFTVNVYAITGVTVSGEAYIVDAAGTSIDDGYVSEVMNGRTVTAEYGGSVNGQNTRVLTGEAYNVTVNGQTLGIGKASEIVVTPVVADSDYSTVTAKIYIAASSQLEAEDAVITVKGKATTEQGYEFAGDFAVNSVVSFTFESAFEGDATIQLKVANGYLIRENGQAWMETLPLSDVIDINVNGNNYPTFDNVTLSKSETVGSEDYQPLYTNFEVVSVSVGNIVKGSNTLSITLHSNNYITTWNAPALVNIDWIRVNPATLDEETVDTVLFPKDKMYIGLDAPEPSGLRLDSYDELIAVYSNGVTKSVSADSIEAKDNAGSTLTDSNAILNLNTIYTITKTYGGKTATEVVRTGIVYQAEGENVETNGDKSGTPVFYIGGFDDNLDYYVLFKNISLGAGSYKVYTRIANNNQNSNGIDMDAMTIDDAMDLSVSGSSATLDFSHAGDEISAVPNNNGSAVWENFIVHEFGTVSVTDESTFTFRIDVQKRFNIDWIAFVPVY